MRIFEPAEVFYNATRQGVPVRDPVSSPQPPTLGPGVVLRGIWSPDYASVLTPEALEFVAKLTRTFGGRREALLARRKERQAAFNRGHRPDFLPETKAVREGDWKVAPVPEELLDRRVEITGPVDRKMIINALNSGANVFMADFEDSNCADLGQRGRRAGQPARRRPPARSPSTAGNGKQYALERRRRRCSSCGRAAGTCSRSTSLVDGEPVPGALFDFGLFFFHNAKELLARGTGPYFYLPKMESHLEARLWNDVFRLRPGASSGIPRGTIKATVLIETMPAAFEMDEILYELREHSAGLNCGRWDYIFSFIKKLAGGPRRRCCPIAPGDDGQGVPATPTRGSSSRPATGAACTRWAAWRRRSRSRTTRPPTRRRSPRCAPTSCAR